MTAFVDTSVLYALLAADTDEHGAAASVFAAVSEREALITHSYVVVETITLLQRRLGMAAVETLVEDILPAVAVTWVDAGLHERALNALRSSPSRSVSLVDRVSFAFMRSRGLRLALSLDSDFRAEGFDVLPA